MTDIAVVKPDHIGDFVLSVPALRALRDKFGTLELFADSSSQFLQQYFLPSGVKFRPTGLSHLQKDGTGIELQELVAQLKRRTMVVFLRDDGFCREAYSILNDRALITDGDNTLHETRIQQRAIEALTGPYSRTQQFWPEGTPRWPSEIRSVGISLSAGFFANKIPPTCWLSLATSLRRQGIRIKLIGGPFELDELKMMGRMLSLAVSDIVIGGPELDRFYECVGECEVVVGADSGTLHLISARVPVLGIFTASPWRRFSPFGTHNRVLYADVPCSPCIQFSKGVFNGCVSRECAALISAADIERALFASEVGEKALFGPLVYLVTGPSHISS